MIYGITGNTDKDRLWQPVAHLIHWMTEQDIGYLLHPAIARGLHARNLVDGARLHTPADDDVAAGVDIMISFGGDGTLLRSAHEVGTRETPILGVNIGRLGFLANIEVGQLEATILQLEEGAYTKESRLVLSVEIEGEGEPERLWALNEIVIERGGPVGMLAIEVYVDGRFLNQYWADGLIVSTPTGSTAYSLAVGGPIVAPGSDVLILSPLAPHSLTIRPIVIPSSSVIEARVMSSRQPYVLAADGISTEPRKDNACILIRKAAHSVTLVTLPDQHYFQTLRSKLSWGGGQPGNGE
jgi:NAD+ kinase